VASAETLKYAGTVGAVEVDKAPQNKK